MEKQACIPMEMLQGLVAKAEGGGIIKTEDISEPAVTMLIRMAMTTDIY